MGRKRGSTADAALRAGRRRLRGNGNLASAGDRLLSFAKINRIFATIMPLVGLSPALAPLLGSWILTHFSWQAIFATLFVITLLLMLPALRLKPSGKARTEGQDKLTFATLLRSKTYRGNVLIYAACSASFLRG